MRRANLSAVLLVFSLSMVAVAILFVGIAGVALLERLADERTLARVRWGGEGAVEAVERTADRLVAAAQLLAERPTLSRLVAREETDSLQTYLATYARRGGFAACAVIAGDRWLVATHGRVPWARIEPAAISSEGWSVLRGDDRWLMAAGAPVASGSAMRVVTAEVLDDAYAASITRRVGLPVRLVPAEAVDREGLDPAGLLHRRARAGEIALGTRVGSPPRYIASVPLADPAGRIVAVVEAALPAGEVDGSLGRLTRTLILLATGAGLLVSVLSLWLARQIARPIEHLTQAAARMGHGDFSSPVPVAAGLETGTLSNAMEEMRTRILRLTGELRRKQAEAEAILTGIAEGVYSVDRERRIRYLNPQAAQLLGIEANQALGRFCGDVLRPRADGGARPCEAGGCPILHARFSGTARAVEHLETGGGVRTTVITSAAGDTAAGQEDLRQFQILRDETDLEASRRLRDAVLANISHEFRTPLSAQLASLELLHERLEAEGSPAARELVLSIERGSLRLTQLIDNLLESTRIEAGRDELRRQRVVLDEVIEAAVEMVAPLIGQRGQRLEIDLPYPIPVLTGDGPRLTQVFVNLLANANKFAPEGSAIHIGGGIADAELRLWVEDEGPGLPDGDEEAIFRRFTRSPGREPEAGGMGLGLYIVRSIVDRHGGRIEATSSETGTRMCVILPRES